MMTSLPWAMPSFSHIQVHIRVVCLVCACACIQSISDFCILCVHVYVYVLGKIDTHVYITNPTFCVAGVPCVFWQDWFGPLQVRNDVCMYVCMYVDA